MGRKIMALFAGIATGLLVILILRVINISYFPFPDNLTWKDSSDMATYFTNLPDKAFILYIFSHAIGAFLAGLISSLVSQKNRFTIGIIAGFFIFVFVFIINFTYDFPRLFLMVDILATAIAGFTGAILGNKKN
ncbi:MAG: TIGR04086 family membrane protein [Saprospiraceae bacterium]